MKRVTLSEYLYSETHQQDECVRRVADIVKCVALIGKIIFRQVRRAGMDSMLGDTGKINIQGEEVQRLDEYSNDRFIEVFQRNRLIGSLISEEMGERLKIEVDKPAGAFLMTLDPLDGSSNIEVDVTIGSIFALFHREGGFDNGGFKLPRGSEMVACGYVLYGATSYLVFWMQGMNVCMFNLDMPIGAYVMTSGDVKIPAESSIYSVNEANYSKWAPDTQKVVDYLRTGRNGSTSRYIGSMVADFHRNLLKGGVYLYPGEAKKPEGKIRLLYEAAPLGKLVTMAGGKASTGRQNILDITPETPHQRCPTILGSPKVVEEIEKIYAEFG
ncbi:MAG: class 1 fructose-1,6-bisphosphatase [Candidatus Zixiibacteriota bacterium]